MRVPILTAVVALWAVLGVAPGACAQAPEQPEHPTSPLDGPGGPGGPGPRGAGPMGAERKLVKEYDADGDGRLNAAERAEAREFIRSQPRRGPRGGGRGREPATEGARVSPADVRAVPGKALYDPTVLRTIFLDFESEDWEAELADFYNTDVEVPATMTVDGVRYPGVGVHFRGASSYFMVGPGHKRSLNVDVDFTDPQQRLMGYTTLNLLNLSGDPSFLSTVLFSHLAKGRVAAPKANHVRVVINGESWGVYTNVQQFDRVFLAEHFGTEKGARWKVKGSPGGASGLDYIGDDVEDYQRRYEMKSGGKKDWEALVDLCRTLSTTPIDELEEALKGKLDVEGALWFLALDVGLANSDGYWTRASDYTIYRDPTGVFHIVPHDMNEAFAVQGGGPGGARGGGPPGNQGRGPQPADGGRERGRPDGEGPPGDRPPPDRARPPREPGGDRPGAGPDGDRARQPDGAPRRRPSGAELDPFVALEDSRKPLRSRLLKVPAFRARYIENLRTLAGQLAWENFGPVVAQRRALIEEHVRADTKKLSSFAAFERATSSEAPPAPPAAPAPPEGGRPPAGLRAFAEQRSRFLLNHPEIAGTGGGDRRRGGREEPAR